MKCHACGQDNADSALFCTACRRPLVAPSKAPTRLEPLVAAPAPSVATPPPPPPGDLGGRNRYAPPDAGSADNGGRHGDPSQVLTDEELRAAVIGNSNTLYYLGRFERLAHGEGGGWNWPAFLVTWYWLLYRKMWVPATLYFFAPYAILILVAGIAAAAPMFGAVLWLAWAVAWLIAPGLLANGWYYKHCQNKIRDVRARGGSKDQVLARLESVGGTSNVAIIIVAVVCVFFIPGILAAIALPAYQTYTVKAKMADAILESTDVATVVGRQYEATGQFPTDIDRVAHQVPHQSKFVQGIELDGTTGTLTVHVEASPTIAGTILFVPSADSSRHVSWSCSSADLVKYMPKSCRG